MPNPGDLDRGETTHLEDQVRLRMALEAARAGAWEWEIGSDRTLWSPENYALMGLPPGSGRASYDDWLARVHPDDRERAQAEVARAVQERGDLDFEYRVVWPDGTVRSLRDIGKMMLDAHGSPIGMYGIQIDVTERRSLEDRLSRAQRMEAMGRVAGAVAHDFNNLLTVIAGNSELLETDPLLHTDLRPMVEEVHRAAQRAATLTQRLLAFGRRQVLSAQVLDLNRLIAELGSMLVRTLGEDIDVTIRLAPDLGCVWADPGQLEQVLLNLIVNARDAMPSGGRLSVETYEADGGLLLGPNAAALPPGRYVGVQVQDSGCGMDAATMDRIFDPFFTTKPAYKGTGLGLASVYGIIKQSGGYIRVESAPGEGTTFTFFLPRVDEREHAAKAGGDTVQTDRGSESILVVEDEPAIREMIESSLRSRGYSVRSAASAEEAMALVDGGEHGIDLLVTDVVLPGLTGPALSAQLTQIYPGIKVLFLTGYGYDALGEHGAVEGMEIVHKPFSLRDLVRRVREVLGETGGD